MNLLILALVTRNWIYIFTILIFFNGPRENVVLCRRTISVTLYSQANHNEVLGRVRGRGVYENQSLTTTLIYYCNFHWKNSMRPFDGETGGRKHATQK